MPRFIYMWHTNLDRFALRAVVGPVTDDLASTVDRVVDQADLDALLAELDARCAPPWCAHGVVEADGWAQVAEQVRAWHFT